MFARLLLLFILVPTGELALLIVIGRHLGVLPTVALILITGLIGAWLTRREGARTWRDFRSALAVGRVPGEELQQGLAILIGGALLLTPGIVTDLAGFLLLLPPSRQVVLREVRRRIERRLLHDEKRVDARFWTREPPPL